jgi:hypothetical protein
MLTGHYYWRSDERSIGALLQEIVIKPLPLASERAEEQGAKELPPGFDAWFERCVARDSNARFRDGAKAWRALSRILKPRGSAWEFQTVRRSRYYALSALCALLVVIAVGVLVAHSRTSGVETPRVEQLPSHAARNVDFKIDAAHSVNSLEVTPIASGALPGLYAEPAVRAQTNKKTAAQNAAIPFPSAAASASRAAPVSSPPNTNSLPDLL